MSMTMDPQLTHELTQLAAEAVLPSLLTQVSGFYVRVVAQPSWPAVAVQDASETVDELQAEYAALESAAANHVGLIPAFTREELRLDVDGEYPQMTASGTASIGAVTKVHWIARLSRIAANRWRGPIWYKQGNAQSFPYTEVVISAFPGIHPAQRRVMVRLKGPGLGRSVLFRFVKRTFRAVNFEFDHVTGATEVRSIDTHAHPNRPTTLPMEQLSIESVFQRAGFEVSAGGSNALSVDDAGTNARWSDAEMHDAMQVHWSRNDDAPQWALWVLTAGLHEQGPSLGGVMFDEIGQNHRQGTAVFSDSFIANAPSGDAADAAWVARMRFWTGCHEMGHAFNLAHSWQKDLIGFGGPWIPLQNEHEIRSFMNYPYRVEGGEQSFFSDFEFRFSDSELLFMRHAPESFVRMGDADWFENHAFERETRCLPFRLELSIDRPKPFYSFLEPVVLQLALRNVSGAPQIVAANALSATDHLAVIIQKRGGRAQRWRPFAHYCLESKAEVLAPNEAHAEALFVSVGTEGWQIAEPGEYTVQVFAQVGAVELVSNLLSIRVGMPRDGEEDAIAADYFTTDVGRVLAFDGSKVLNGANDALRRVVDALPTHSAATHARVALAKPKARAHRLLDRTSRKFKVQGPQIDAAHKEVEAAITKDPRSAMMTLGRIEYQYYADEFAQAFGAAGASELRDQYATAAASVRRRAAAE